MLDTAKDITVGDVTYRIPADVYNTAKDAIANATTVAGVLSAYNTALEAQVEVTPVTGVSVAPAQATIRVGNTTTIKAIITPDDATEKAVTWTSSDDTVATVDSNGVVTGVKVGTATITATTIDGNFTATCEVNVERKHSSGSSSGGGGGSSAAKHGVTISDSKNGAVTASAAKAETGDKVILTPKADEGYELDKITAKDKDGKEVKLKAEKDGTYSFTMPKGGVTVDTTFKQAEGATNTDKPAAATKTIVLQIGSTAVLVDDQAIINDVAPVIRNDRTLVPIRVITEALGGQVAWNEAAKEVTLTVNGKEIKMTIGKVLEKYGVAPVIIGGRTFVPVRFVADELGAVTTWDDAIKTVTIQAVK
ncbi:stalk domain-containing protein [Anaerotignum faecicola]